MSFDFIHDFQYSLHRLLSNDSEIRLNVDRIYVSVVQDAKYPCILINIIKVNNLSVPLQNIYKLEFEICVFAKDSNINILSLLANKITNKIVTNSLELKDYIVAGIKADSINFERGKDLITTKLKINYKSLLKGKIL